MPLNQMDADCAPSAVFFPPGLDRVRTRWFSKFLCAFEEDPLWPPRKNGETYRFMWLRSFHEPILARLDIGDGQAFPLVSETLALEGIRRGLVSRKRDAN